MKIFIKGKAKAQRIRGMGEHFNAAFLKICLFKPYRGLSILCSLGGLLPHPLTKKCTYIINCVERERGIPEPKRIFIQRAQSNTPGITQNFPLLKDCYFFVRLHAQIYYTFLHIFYAFPLHKL